MTEHLQDPVLNPNMTGPKINLRYANSECSAKGWSLKLFSIIRVLRRFSDYNFRPRFKFKNFLFQTLKGMWKIFTPADGSSFDKPDAILGPVCKNAVEPALRYAEVHNVSVITPGAQGAAFDRGDGFSERVESRGFGGHNATVVTLWHASGWSLQRDNRISIGQMTRVSITRNLGI